MDTDRAKFQKVAQFLAALAHGAEHNIGPAANSICFLAGKRMARAAVQATRSTTDPVEALEIMREALAASGILWEGEAFQGARENLVQIDGDVRRMRVVYQTCTVRSTLFTYAREQKRSLCHMAHGIVAGAMEKVMNGAAVKMEILQACPEHCIKEMIWEIKK